MKLMDSHTYHSNTLVHVVYLFTNKSHSRAAAEEDDEEESLADFLKLSADKIKE